MDILKGREGISGGGALYLQGPGSPRPDPTQTPGASPETLEDWKLLWQRSSQNTEESRSLERQHPPIPSSAPRVKWRPLRTGTVLGPPPRRGDHPGPPGAGGRSGPKQSLSLVEGPEGAPLGAAPVSCSMLRPEVLFTADLPPGSLVPAVRWRLPRSAMW